MEGDANLKSFFVFRETSNNGWTICPVHKEFLDENMDRSFKGSLNLLACRISGLSWAQWLRYCRQHGARLYGNKSKYPIAVWKEPNNEFLNQLNIRANELSKYINFKELNL